MNRVVRRVLVGAVLAAAALGFALATLPFRHGVVVQAWLLICGGVLLLQLVLATRAPAATSEPSAFERALRAESARGERPPELARLEREVILAIAGQFYLHRRLRPTLREVAAQRLRDRRGLDLDSGDEAVVEALGPDAWALLRPDRKEHWDPDAAGIPLPDLARVVTALETI